MKRNEALKKMRKDVKAAQEPIDLNSIRAIAFLGRGAKSFLFPFQKTMQMSTRAAAPTEAAKLAWLLLTISVACSIAVMILLSTKCLQLLREGFLLLHFLLGGLRGARFK